MLYDTKQSLQDPDNLFKTSNLSFLVFWDFGSWTWLCTVDRWEHYGGSAGDRTDMTSLAEVVACNTTYMKLDWLIERNINEMNYS